MRVWKRHVRRAACALTSALCLGFLTTGAPAEAQTTLQAVITNPGVNVAHTAATGPVESHYDVGGLVAEAVANYGQLGAKASVSSSGSINATAVWQDSFTITGLNPGQLVTFSVTTGTHGSLIVPIGTGNQGTMNDNYAFVASWLWGFPDAVVDCQLPGLLGGGLPPCNDSGTHFTRNTYSASIFLATEDNSAGDLGKTFQVQLFVGQTYQVQQRLLAVASMTGVSGVTTESDFLGTATFSLTPVGADHGYTTDSGHRYDAPVTNTAPTANAGSNQTVRPGTTVHLDGSGSFDDNTPTNLLQYAWSFLSVPNGSAVMTMTGANTATPSFEPDLSGDYVLQLVVTDQAALSGQPSSVTIGENPPPTANAGPDQLAILGSVVALTGSGTDPDDDALTYAWALTGAPTGSTAAVYGSTLANATFVPDRPGVYAAQLTVSDPFGPGTPDSVQITMTTATGYAEIQTQAASAQVLGLPASALTNRGNQNALTQFLSNAVVALHHGNVTAARQQLEQAISRTDGCALRGTSDGNGPSRDWVTTCPAQNQVYPLLVDALVTITQ